MFARHALFLKSWNEKGDKGWWTYECPTCGPGVLHQSRDVKKGKDLEMHLVLASRR